MKAFAQTISRRSFAAAFPFFSAGGLLLTFYKFLDDVARDVPGRFRERLIEEMTGAWGAWLLLPLAVLVVRRYGLRKPLAHGAAVLVFSAAHTTWNLLSRKSVFFLLGLGAYDYGHLRIRYLMEFPIDIIIYSLMAALTWFVDRYRRAREREVALARAELENLRLQLHPHFLFNALNTISALMYEDAARADRMISRLSDLLRLVLREPAAQEVPLDQEMQSLDLYLDIMRTRFGDKLRVDCRLEPETARSLVPQLILQPIVENAIKHGSTPGTSEVRIGVSARRENADLVLEVNDEGPGISDLRPTGIGLRNTAERLARLYGSRGGLHLENRGSPGLTVAIRMPFRTA